MEATLRVGLPGWLVAAGRHSSWSTAFDVTALVEEWALALLDPVDALRRATPAALELPGWSLCGRATVSPSVMKLVREAASDPEVVAHVERSLGRGKLSVQGSCLLLGLAAVTALDANIGRASASLLADVKKRQAARNAAAAERERQRSAEAAATPDAARPSLSPIPADAFGKAALT
jgi:hypothetical protein